MKKRNSSPRLPHFQNRSTGCKPVSDFKTKIVMDRNLQPEHLSYVNKDKLNNAAPIVCQATLRDLVL